MAKSRKSISQRNDATCINNRRGMARRAKRNSSKKERQSSKKESIVYNPTWVEYEEQVCCPSCEAPHELIRPGHTQPTCLCDEICDACGGRIVSHFLGEDSRYPNRSGLWCNRCGLE